MKDRKKKIKKKVQALKKNRVIPWTGKIPALCPKQNRHLNKQ